MTAMAMVAVIVVVVAADDFSVPIVLSLVPVHQGVHSNEPIHKSGRTASTERVLCETTRLESSGLRRVQLGKVMLMRTLPSRNIEA